MNHLSDFRQAFFIGRSDRFQEVRRYSLDGMTLSGTNEPFRLRGVTTQSG